VRDVITLHFASRRIFPRLCMGEGEDSALGYECVCCLFGDSGGTESVSGPDEGRAELVDFERIREGTGRAGPRRFGNEMS
jgi:hypothetical protein